MKIEDGKLIGKVQALDAAGVVNRPGSVADVRHE